MTSAYRDDERLSSSPLIRAAPPQPIAGRVLATLSTETGGGAYTWVRYVPAAGSQPAGLRQGTAWELSLKTGLTLPRSVVVFFDAGRWWFDAGSSGGGGGGGASGWYGNGIDGDVTVSAVVAPTLIQSGGSGGWATDTHFPLILAVDGASLIAAGATFAPAPAIDSSKTYAFLLRDAFFHNLTLGPSVILIPWSTTSTSTPTSIICCSGTLSGPPTGAGAAIDAGGDMYVILSWGIKYNGFLGALSNGGTFVAPWTGAGADPHTYQSLPGYQGGGHGGGPGNGFSLPPFDETSSVGLRSGSGGGVSPTAGGAGIGRGSPMGHPLNSGPAWLTGAPLWGTRSLSQDPAFGGCSGGGGVVSSTGGGALPPWFMGQGGSGGGPIVIRAKTVSAGSGLAIRSNGGAGFAGYWSSPPGLTAQNNGGGGGGNPGWITCASDNLDPAVTFSVNPGAGGAGSGTGQNGTAAGATGALFTGPPNSM